mmetsp:Transcript_17584/g.48604  ORF Transcript_17584/g.48604 Transcript_17584/m.48604 type:complete len:84 (+) Transcript_17584:182-433(+)
MLCPPGFVDDLIRFGSNRITVRVGCNKTDEKASHREARPGRCKGCHKNAISLFLQGCIASVRDCFHSFWRHSIQWNQFDVLFW